jgi:anthranilate synthase/phosphoribosyltransferase
MQKILVLDNFDSFTYNLVDFFRLLGCSVRVFRNTTPVAVLEREDFDLLVLSPGPSVPRQAGNMFEVIERFYQYKPILGVCLGHQALIEFFGGTIANIAPVHGKAAAIDHDGRGIFTGIEKGACVARYHSWAADLMPAELEVSARTPDGVVMGVRHKRYPIEGIQFHPESVLSMRDDVGMRILSNVVEGRLSAGNQVYRQLATRLQSGQTLPADLLRRFLTAVSEGQLSDDQKQILLVGLSLRLREPESLARFVGAVAATAPTIPVDVEAVDICGTGGSNLPRINTSTLAALLLAGPDLRIAKHGNRAAAGRFGSFNLLESLGVPIHLEVDRIGPSLAETGLAFLFAPEVYPVFRHFAPIRSQMSIPTVFNVLGPLVNPLQPKRQFVGAAFEDLMEVIFEAGILLGKTHFIVVRGEDGLDEISVSAPTRVFEYRDGRRSEYLIRPEDFGIEPVPFSAVSAANGDQCLDIARAMINGECTTDHWRLVAANAAFIYTRFVEDIPLPEAFDRMKKRIFDGEMRRRIGLDV